MMDIVGGHRETVPALPRRPRVRAEPGGPSVCHFLRAGAALTHQGLVRCWGTPLLGVSNVTSLRVCTPRNSDERDGEEASVRPRFRPPGAAAPGSWPQNCHFPRATSSSCLGGYSRAPSLPPSLGCSPPGGTPPSPSAIGFKRAFCCCSARSRWLGELFRGRGPSRRTR